MRAIERDSIPEIAVVDLLPGGLEPVTAPPVDEENTEAATDQQEPPVAKAGNRSDWRPAFVNTRDDRVVLYGSLGLDAITYEYRVRATNAGIFRIPAPYAEGMYDRALQGSGEGGSLTIFEP
jgi:uncharacterized protein YfaS (alpha-2-macroglobulin family)